jgi:hypothetical protein
VATKIECEFNKKLLTEAACSMEPIPTGGSIVQLYGTFAKDAEKIWVIMQFQMTYFLLNWCYKL